MANKEKIMIKYTSAEEETSIEKPQVCQGRYQNQKNTGYNNNYCKFRYVCEFWEHSDHNS